MANLSISDLHKELSSFSSVLITAVFSKPSAAAIYRKVRIRRSTETQDEMCFFAESFTETQAFHRTLNVADLKKLLIEEVGTLYKHSVLETQSQQITILSNKKGKITMLKKPLEANPKKSNDSLNYTENKGCNNQASGTQSAQASQGSHNRQKEYILTEGQPIPFLVHLGVMSEDGKVIASKYDKFRQINRFLEFIEDVLPEPKDRPVRILDFGCGKSYLTFALYYYLTEIRHLKANITGLDIKKDVIENCSALAQKWAYKGLHFELGRIEEYREQNNSGGEKTLDMVILLHACDTASDYALAYAVKHDAKIILAVPCCQHELNAALGKHCPEGILDSFMKYGIVKERFAALATDLMRAELLEKVGYSVQLMEFIDITHTPKNLLIRAIRRTTAHKNNDAPYEALCEALGVRNKLDELLKLNESF